MPALSPGELGPAGIVRLPDGDLIVGPYSEGTLLRIDHREIGGAISSVLLLERAIANPDGLALAPNGRLLVVDGAVESGNGALLAVDLEDEPPLPVETLVEGLDLPLNLTVRGQTAFVTEGRLRHLMLDDPLLPMPEEFRVVIVDLPRA